MDTVILEEPGRFTFTQTDPATPGPGEALVRVHRIGVCGTDLHAFAGQQNFFEFPRILGHELGVEVLSAPDNPRGISAGDFCAVEPFLPDPEGSCPPEILARTPNATPTMRVLGVHSDGGMRETFCLPVDRLFASASLTPDQLCLIEPLSISDHAVQRARVQAGDHVLVIGVGPIGLAAVQFALAAGGKVTVLEVNEDRRQFVADATGVPTLAAQDGSLYDVVLDATGNVHAMQGAFEAVQFGGRLVFIGHTKGEIRFNNPLFHSREMSVMASRNSYGRFPEIIEMIEQGKIDTRPWITHRMALADVPADFPGLAASPGLVKCVIEV